MKKKYRREMEYVYALINEMDRKLDHQIRDLDDVRLIMDTLKKIREQEVDMELKIEPIEEAFNIVTRYEVPVDQECLEQVDNLRDTWQNLLARAQESHVLLLNLQPHFENDLRNNLEKFRADNEMYCEEYRSSGPMQPGLSPRDASDRQILFQNRFDGMWRKLQTYQSGEELFGLPITDYPELSQIRKELNLLQKLYKLYNDVIDRVSSYYDIPWGEVGNAIAVFYIHGIFIIHTFCKFSFNVQVKQLLLFVNFISIYFKFINDKVLRNLNELSYQYEH